MNWYTSVTCSRLDTAKYGPHETLALIASTCKLRHFVNVLVTLDMFPSHFKIYFLKIII